MKRDLKFLCWGGGGEVYYLNPNEETKFYDSNCC